VIPRWRRPLLLLVTLGACGPVGTFDLFPAGSFNLSLPPGTCGIGPALGVPSDGFSYVCPALPDGGLDSDAASDAGAVLPYESDPYCALVAEVMSNPRIGVSEALFLQLYGIPTVAVGAPFQLAYEDPEAGAPTPSITVAAAVPADVQSNQAGLSITVPGSLGFLAWQGADVAAYTHILARSPVSLGLSPASSFVAADHGYVGTDGSAATPLVLSAGSIESVVAFAEADDGTMLAGGSPACTFESSAPQLLSVQGRGVVAVLMALAGGDVTLSAQCGLLDGSIGVQITGPALNADLEASADAEQALGDAGEAGEDGATAPDAGSSDASEAGAP